MKTLRGFLGNKRGAAAVEFALVIVPLLLFLFGTIEFARLMWTRQSMQSLSMSAARCMGILQTHCSSNGTSVDTAMTTTYIISRASGFGVPLTAANITLNASATVGTQCRVSGFSYVKINYVFASVAPKLITALTGDKILETTACFPNQT